MHSKHFVLLTLVLFVSANLSSAQTPSTRFTTNYGKLPLSFEPNLGQTDAKVQFVSRGAGYTIFLSPTSATFALQHDDAASQAALPGQRPSLTEPGVRAVVRMDLLGANRESTLQPQDKLPGVANYLMGSTSTKWPTNLPTYAKTRSRNVYPGIDLVYYGTQGQLEYDFVLAPQADPSNIRLKFAGATPLVDASGDLVLSLATNDRPNDIRFHKPVLYQLIEGLQKPVNGKFIVAANREVSFRVSRYDRTRELVIDPTLVYSSFLGGSSQQSVINGMAMNSAGQIYVTGTTNAVDYPTTAGVIQPVCPAPMTGGTKCGASSSSAAFVAKIAADGQSLIYSTYLGGGGAGPGVGGASVSQGGSGSELGSGIAVDANDNAWVVGLTNSNNFPVTADAYSLYCEPETLDFNFTTLVYEGEFSGCARVGGNEYNYSGTYSLFLVKLNPLGTHILYGTFLGGTQGETQASVALDPAGNIYVSGAAYTAANGAPAQTGNIIFPTTASAYQKIPQANAWSPFIAVLAPNGHSLMYSSYLSATAGQTYAGALAVGGGKAFIGGYTQSPSFPTTAGALSSTCPGNSPTQCPNNGYVAAFDITKSGAASLVFSTYLNGTHVSSAGIGLSTSAVAVLAADAAGNVYAGGTNQYRDFPTTPGVLQPTCNATHNDACGTGFVTKLSPAGALVWSTFYGSPSASGQYGVSAIALDSGNNVYIANNADGAGDMPLTTGFQNYTSGVAYVAELSSDASKVLFGSFFGSGANVFPTGLRVDSQGNIYLTGYSAGAIPLVNAHQSTNAGGFNEGFFAKIATGLPPPPSCNYQLNLSGEGFPAQGGNGTILITAGANCPWSVGSLPAGITLTSPASGTGNGTVTFAVAANSGGDLANTLVIAGQAFTIEQEAASLSGLNFIGSMPHLAAEENWTTAFTLVNKGAATATARLSVFGDATDPTGNGPLTLPLAFPQATAPVSALLAASFDNSMPAKSSLIVDTAGSQTPPVLVGSAQLSATGAVDGFAIFHLIPGAQEAVVPMETRNAGSYLLAFDNTGGVVLGVAVENVSPQSGNIGVVIRDDTGTIISAPSTTISLAGSAHTSFVLSQQYPVTAAIRGTIEFDTPSGGRISVLGIRTTPEGTSNTLTTIPALASVGTGGGSIAHLATGNGWQTTFVLVNTGAASAQAHLKFFADNGTPLSLPLAFPQAGGGASTTAATLDRTLPAGASLIVQSTAPLSDPAPTIGSAQLTTDGNVGGFVIFRFNPNGQEAVVPLESRNATGYILAFDNTASTATGVAINAVSAQAVNIPVIVRDDTGAQITTDTLSLAANGHLAFTLAVDKYPAAANIRGTVEFDAPAGAQIGALGIRIPVAHTFTTLPAFVK